MDKIQTPILISQQLCKTENDWNTDKNKTYIPALGEIVIYEVDDIYNFKRFKVGDGKNTIIDLPFYMAGKIVNTLNSVSLGFDNIAGCKGFYWYDILADTSSISISTEQPKFNDTTSKVNSELQTQLATWTMGDIVTIVNGRQYAFCIIKSVDKDIGKLTLESLPFTERADASLSGTDLISFWKNIKFDDFSVFNISKPNNGLVELGAAAVAIGTQNKALGSASTAIGWKNTVAGDYGFATGNENIAGISAFAAGYANQALGNRSIAFGHKSIAKGFNSFAGGYSGEIPNEISENKWDSSKGFNIAGGDASFVYGTNNYTSAEASIALGKTNKITAICGGAFGYDNSVKGNYAFALGIGNKINGNASTAIGNNSVANGHQSFAGGYGKNLPTEATVEVWDSMGDTSKFNAALGQGSFVYGMDNITGSNAKGAFTLGRINKVLGSYAGAFGYKNTASQDYSYALGNSNSINTKNCIAIGYGNKIKSNSTEGSLVVGKFNETSNNLFTIGNGSDNEHRQDIFTISATGEVNTIGDIYVKGKKVLVQGEDSGVNDWGQLKNKPSIAVGSGSRAIVLNERGTGNASGNYSLIGGKNSSATGAYAFAFGQSAWAMGTCSVAFGNGAHATADEAFACGHNTSAKGNNSFVAGYQNVATGRNSIAMGGSTRKLSANEIQEYITWEVEQNSDKAESQWENNKCNIAIGNYSFTQGEDNLVFGNHSIAGGYQNSVTGPEAIALGHTNNVKGPKSIALGWNNSVEGNSMYTMGYGNTVHYDIAAPGAGGAFGYCNKVGKQYGEQLDKWGGAQAFAMGSSNEVYEHKGIALGCGNYIPKDDTTDDYEGRIAMGRYNAKNVDAILEVGIGSSNTLRANALRISSAGNCYSKGMWSTSGADYAEYYEWEDGNTNSEDRRGYFVTFSEGSKIRKATSNDTYILGIVSTTPAVVGNNYSEYWNKKYLTDIFGQELTETITIPAVTKIINEVVDVIEHKEIDENGLEVIKYEEIIEEREIEVEPEKIRTAPILNPDYNPEQTYKGRDQRIEWSPIGTHGQLIAIDDGTCKVNGYCKITNEGIATIAETQTNYRVIERLDDTHIKVVLK